VINVASDISSRGATAISEDGLPDFANPPVDETALSIQFQPIPKFNIPHFGLYWSIVRREYPNFEVQQPIGHVTEQFGPAVRSGRQLGFALLELPEVRCWFIDESGTKLVQVQRDHFVHNWRKITGSEVYPRYPILRASLEREWRRFREFLEQERLEPPKVNQVEVTYVNYIDWDGSTDLDKVVKALASPVNGRTFLPEPERTNMQVAYRMPNDAGRLHIALTPVIRGRDAKEVLQMTLTARLAPKSPSDDAVFGALDLGRKWVVQGFTDFTTPEMPQIWGKQ